MITTELKNKYLANPNSCPHCDYDILEVGSFKNDGTDVVQRVRCAGCHRSWSDVYELITIEE